MREYSFNGICELLAPVTHVQLTGRKLILGIPQSSLSATFHASPLAGTVAMSLPNLVKHLFAMSANAFEEAGGFWGILNPGDLIVVPSCSVIAGLLGV